MSIRKFDINDTTWFQQCILEIKVVLCPHLTNINIYSMEQKKTAIYSYKIWIIQTFLN